MNTHVKMPDPSTSSALTRQLTIVVPAFKEAEMIETTLRAVVDVAERVLDAFEVIVVDDGSRDGTGDIAEAFAAGRTDVLVLRQPVNKGVGAAYLLGLSHARFPFISLVPGDNAFTREALENVFAAAGSADLVVSYRDNMDVRTPIRRVLSVICTALMRVVTGHAIRDAHSMYVFPVALARQIETQPGYGYHIESLGRLLSLTKSVRQVPATLNPRPDASSGVLKPRVVALLAMTVVRLGLWRVTLPLRGKTRNGDALSDAMILGKADNS